MPPAAVATVLAPRRRGDLARVAGQPTIHVVVVVLLAPQQPGEGLPHHRRLIRAGVLRRQRRVEPVGLGPARRRDLVELALDVGRGAGQPQPDLRGPPRRDRQPVPQRRLGPRPGRIDARRPRHDVVVDAVFGERRGVRPPVQADEVRLVVAEDGFRVAGVTEHVPAEIRVLGDHSVPVDAQHRLRRPGLPGPGVAEPQGRQHVQRRLVRPHVAHPHPHQQVARRRLGIVDRHLPVPVLVEDARVDQLVLGVGTGPSAVLGRQVVVGELRLRIVVPPRHPRMGRRAVQIPPVVLDILPVVAFRTAQAERPLLEDRVPAVPQRQPQTQPLPLVAHRGQPVLVPPVGPRPSVLMRERRPSVPARAVVLPHTRPRPLAHVRTPQPPRRPAPVGLRQPATLRILPPADALRCPPAAASRTRHDRRPPRNGLRTLHPRHPRARLWPTSPYATQPLGIGSDVHDPPGVAPRVTSSPPEKAANTPATPTRTGMSTPASAARALRRQAAVGEPGHRRPAERIHQQGTRHHRARQRRGQPRRDAGVSRPCATSTSGTPSPEIYPDRIRHRDFRQDKLIRNKELGA